MQDQMVIYDNERGQIEWIRAPCDRIPSSLLWIISHPCTVTKHTSYLNSFLFIHSNSDKTIHGFEEGYCWPQSPSIVGLQNDDCPAYYQSNKE
jgi:hypothetical protein